MLVRPPDLRYKIDIMATRTSFKVTIESRDNRSLTKTFGELTRLEWNAQEKLRNAARIFLILLGAMVVSIFIPMLHFILVPTLLIASFVVALDKLKEAARNDGGSAECPKCHATFVIQKSKWSDKFHDTCNHCREDLEIHLVR